MFFFHRQLNLTRQLSESIRIHPEVALIRELLSLLWPSLTDTAQSPHRCWTRLQFYNIQYDLQLQYKLVLHNDKHPSMMGTRVQYYSVMVFICVHMCVCMCINIDRETGKKCKCCYSNKRVKPSYHNTFNYQLQEYKSWVGEAHKQRLYSLINTYLHFLYTLN